MTEWRDKKGRSSTTQRLVQVRSGSRAWLWALAGVLIFFGIIAFFVVLLTIYVLKFQ